MNRLLLAVLLCFAGASPAARAQANTDSPEGVVQAWASAFNECSAEKLAALYDPQATLWGTNASNLTLTPSGVRAYFDGACALRPPIRVALGEVVSRRYGAIATVSGTYVFDREGVAYPSRYSFALIDDAGRWRIVHHHSSTMPGRR